MVYDNVIAYCEKHNMSILAFEQKCDLPNGLVGKWRDKKYNPTVTTLQKIETATKIPIAKWLK